MSDLAEFRKHKDDFMKRFPESPLTTAQRASFKGLNCFDEAPSLRFVLPVRTFPAQEKIEMQTSTGAVQDYVRWGKISFPVDGVAAELTLFRDTNEGELFLPFADATSGKETYGAGRHLEVHTQDDGRVLVDFNYAYNPYCAYNERWRSPLLHGGLELYNVADIIPQDGGGFKICRIPLELRERTTGPTRNRSIEATGCEIRFNLKSDEASFTFQMEGKSAAIELWHGPFMDRDFAIITDQPTVFKVLKPKRPNHIATIAGRTTYAYDINLYRIFLPWRPAVIIRDIKGSFEPPRANQVPSRRILTYGSSITHGNTSIRPTETYPCRLGRLLSMDVIQYGFGGGRQVEPELADNIAARDDWDMATLEMGINLIQTDTVKQFAEKVDYFVSTVKKAHMDKWVFCIDLFPFWMDFDGDIAKARAYRKVVRETVARFAMPKLMHIDGRKLLRDYTGLTGDIVHLAPAGNEEVANRLARVIKTAVGASL